MDVRNILENRIVTYVRARVFPGPKSSFFITYHFFFLLPMYQGCFDGCIFFFASPSISAQRHVATVCLSYQERIAQLAVCGWLCLGIKGFESNAQITRLHMYMWCLHTSTYVCTHMYACGSRAVQEPSNTFHKFRYII